MQPEWKHIQNERPKIGQHIYVLVKISNRHKTRTVMRWGEYELIGNKHTAHSVCDKYTRHSYRSWDHWIPANAVMLPVIEDG